MIVPFPNFPSNALFSYPWTSTCRSFANGMIASNQRRRLDKARHPGVATARVAFLLFSSLFAFSAFAEDTRKSPLHRPFKVFTPERLATLSPLQQKAWNEYLDRSRKHFENEFQRLAEECRAAGLAQSRPAPNNSGEFEPDADVPVDWYQSDEARALTEVVMSYQTPTGGWSKAIDYRQGKRSPGTHWTSQSGEGWHYCGTLDNRSTTEQIKYLARVASATANEEAKAAAIRGIEWLLTAQFPHGGWPQCYPIEPGYHENITLNDDAMTHVLEVLLPISLGKEPFAFVDPSLQQRAQIAFDKGIACLAAAQVKVEGKPTVWCAQHDPLTLAPAAARLKEPPALSGAESAVLLKFLMREGPTTPTVIAMIESAVAWLDAHRLTGLRKTKNAAGKTDYVEDPTSTEIYWARFYDVQTGKPIFAGAQDGIVYSSFHEMASKNKVGYDYFSTRPRDILDKEVARWQKRLKESSKK